MIAAFTAVGCFWACTSCAADNPWGISPSGEDPDHIEISLPEMTEETLEIDPTGETEAEPAVAGTNGETYILFTSDIHCGIDSGFGFQGLYQIRQELEASGYNTILVDDGDALQGDVIGTMDAGQTMLELMNAAGYDVATPGNHEFDYGMDRFLEIVDEAQFPYISCNFTSGDDLLLEPYTIISSSGVDIAFVGITTPDTLQTEAPTLFQDENGEFIYGFSSGDNGQELYDAVQAAVDAAREEGADLVYAMAHLGNEADCEPYTYADVIANTTGIDVLFDGHSHDQDQVTMLNLDGEEVTRSACGTRFAAIGYSHISADGQIIETGIWTWDNDMSAGELLGIDNEMTQVVNDVLDHVDEELNEVIAHTDFDLLVRDDDIVGLDGDPINLCKIGETNMADLMVDSMRSFCDAEIGLMVGGSPRATIPAGDITLLSAYNNVPFNNNICIVELSGQQILDALEWGAHELPDSFGGLLQVSGLTYEIDVSIPSGCITDDNMAYAGIVGPRRVSNVMVGGEPIDPDRIYTVAGQDYFILNGGNGYTMFDGCTVISSSAAIEIEALSTYLIDTLGGEIPDEYADPYGQGRMVINE